MRSPHAASAIARAHRRLSPERPRRDPAAHRRLGARAPAARADHARGAAARPLLSRIGGPGGSERFARGTRRQRCSAPSCSGCVLLFFVAAATQVLGLQAFTDWLARLIDYLPTLIAGVLIIGAGYIALALCRRPAAGHRNAAGAYPALALARVAQVLILVGAILVGADQVGDQDHLPRHLRRRRCGNHRRRRRPRGGIRRARPRRQPHRRAPPAPGLPGRPVHPRCGPRGPHPGSDGHSGHSSRPEKGRVTLPGRIYNEQPIAVISRREQWLSPKP